MDSSNNSRESSTINPMVDLEVLQRNSPSPKPTDGDKANTPGGREGLSVRLSQTNDL